MKYKANILIVDDAEVVRLSYLRSLAEANFNVEAARDGKEALSIMELQSFDVVFLDLRMPGPDGISVLREMKRMWPESEVVIITGFPTIKTAKEAVQLGAYNYLVKPVAPHDVAVWMADPDVLDNAAHVRESLLIRYKYALKSNEWPGQCPEAATLRWPRWALPDDGEDWDVTTEDV